MHVLNCIIKLASVAIFKILCILLVLCRIAKCFLCEKVVLNQKSCIVDKRFRSITLIEHLILVPKIQLGAPTRQRTNTDNNFADTEVEELVAMLRETENLEEQGDILQVIMKPL